VTNIKFHVDGGGGAIGMIYVTIDEIGLGSGGGGTTYTEGENIDISGTILNTTEIIRATELDIGITGNKIQITKASGGATYTLPLPESAPSALQVIQYNGSKCVWTDIGGVTESGIHIPTSIYHLTTTFDGFYLASAGVAPLNITSYSRGSNITLNGFGLTLQPDYIYKISAAIAFVQSEGNFNVSFWIRNTSTTAVLSDVGTVMPHTSNKTDATDGSIICFLAPTSVMNIDLYYSYGGSAGIHPIHTAYLIAEEMDSGKGVSNFQDNILKIHDNTDTTKVAQFDCSLLTTGTTTTFQLPNSGTFGSDTTTFTDSSFNIINNSDNTKKVILDASTITTGTTRTYTLPNSNGTLVNSPVFFDSDFGLKNFATPSKIGVFNVGNISAGQTKIYSLPNKSGSVALLDDVNNHFSFTDSSFNITNETDNTKEVQFYTGIITTGTTRTLTIPNSNGTIALTSDIQTTFTDSAFDVHNISNATKKVKFNTASITTANTRTLTISDQTGTIALTSDISTALTNNAPINKTFIEVVHENTADGGTIAGTGAWHDRPLNSVVYISNAVGCSLTSNQLVGVPAGTYNTACYCIFEKTNATTIRLYDNTNALILKRGGYTNTGSGAGQITNIINLFGRITVTTTATISLQYWCETDTAGTVDMGRYTVTDGSPAVYARVILQRID
jgi:hypothetical protein